MNKKIKVGFDYDNTLRDKRSIQMYCQELLKDPLIEPHIVTRRTNRIDGVNWPHVKPIYWLEVYDLAKKLGIHYDHVHFCHFAYKEIFYRHNNDFVWHLDDDHHDCQLLSKIGIQSVNHIFSSDWIKQCDELIHEAKKLICP